MVVSAGGLDRQGKWKWLNLSRSKYLFSGKALRIHFQGNLLGRIERLLKVKRVTLPPGAEEPEAILERAAAQKWNLRVQKPMCGPEKVIAYVGRYSMRVALSESRIRSFDSESVTFDYRDKRENGKWKRCRMGGTEFVRRYLQHVLPFGFKKIRYYGLWRRALLEQAREAMQRAGAVLVETVQRLAQATARMFAEAELRALHCPRCGKELEPAELYPRPCRPLLALI